MAQATFDFEIRCTIDAFVEQLTAHVRKAALDSVRTALGNGAAGVKASGPVRIDAILGTSSCKRQ